MDALFQAPKSQLTPIIKLERARILFSITPILRLAERRRKSYKPDGE